MKIEKAAKEDDENKATKLNDPFIFTVIYRLILTTIYKHNHNTDIERPTLIDRKTIIIDELIYSVL